MKNIIVNLIKIGLSVLSIFCLVIYVILNMFTKNAVTYRFGFEEMIIWIAIFWLMLSQILSITKYLKVIYKRK
jgi:hypothetical protein